MSDAELAGLRWLERFALRHGRPLRVLHIGNVANNAYNNATIQRSFGIDADVISYGNYHVTGTPEWEDADLVGDLDPSLPDWWAVGLGDWQRPPWFVQGPMLDCLEYLRCRHAGREEEAARIRSSLVLDYWGMLADATARTGGRRAGHPFRAAALATSLKLGAVEGRPPTRAPLSAWWRASGRGAAVLRHKTRLLTDVLAPTLRRARGRRWLSPVARLILVLYTWYRTRGSRPPAPRLDDRFTRLHREHLPAAREQDVEEDTAAARRLAAPWADVLAHYDIVQGYATDGVIPLYHGLENFTAYEHGTIRCIPFEDDTRGRLCSLTYRCAPRIFVTNTDVLPSVARMQIPAERVVHLPHAFDDRKIRAFRAAHADLGPPAGPPVFLSPTRHHWARGDLSWLKGNDVFLRAASRLADTGRAFSIVLAEWGAEVDESKALIAELGLSRLVRWVPIMSKKALWAAYCRAHAVVDQFRIPALGGIGFETLAMGRRLITQLDEATLASFFGACPPVLNAATVDEVEKAMRRVLDDPEDRAGLGAAGCAWIETYHSAARIVASQAQAYRELVGLPGDPLGV